jgi:hypothetical protein
MENVKDMRRRAFQEGRKSRALFKDEQWVKFGKIQFATIYCD